MTENDGSAKRFQLNTLNGIFLALAFVFFAARFVLGGNFSAYQVGRIAGSLMAAVLIPYVLGLVAYLVTFRKQTVGRVVFNVVVVMLVMGQIAQGTRRAQVAKDIQSLSTDRKAFVGQVREAGTFDEAGDAVENYSQGFNDKLERIEAQSSGVEKEAMRVIRKISSDAGQVTSRWQTALGGVESAEVLDPAALTTSEEFGRQIQVVETFLSENQRYRTHFNTMPETTRAKLQEVGQDNPMVKGMIAGAQNAFDAQKGVFNPLLDAYDGYGSAILSALRLLESHQGQWSFEAGVIEFADDSIRDDYIAIVDRLQNESETVNRLSGELLTIMESLN